MSTTSILVAQPRSAAVARVCDYLELTKPKIAVLELVVVAAAAVVATWGQPDPLVVWHALVGTLLIAASASAANQWIERRLDARMSRTAGRPLPAGRLAAWEAAAFSACALVCGAAYLAAFVNLTCVAWALATWIVYVAVYTPLKTVSPLNTGVGAVAGALPVLIGWTATGAALDQRALALVLVVFLWQFPHFMAIAWLYRDEYARAGHQMLTVLDPTGRRAGLQAVLSALALLPVSIVPVLDNPGLGSVLFLVAATLLGVGQLAFAAAFWRQASQARARLLLRASLVYLPTWLAMLMLAPWL